MLLDFFLIVVMLVWLAELYLDGAISIEHAAMSVVGLTMLLALSRVSRWLRHFLEIAFALSVLLVFLIWHQGGDLASIGAILPPLLGVLLVLFGLYLIIVKVFGGPSGRK